MLCFARILRSIGGTIAPWSLLPNAYINLYERGWCAQAVPGRHPTAARRAGGHSECSCTQTSSDLDCFFAPFFCFLLLFFCSFALLFSLALVAFPSFYCWISLALRDRMAGCRQTQRMVWLQGTEDGEEQEVEWAQQHRSGRSFLPLCLLGPLGAGFNVLRCLLRFRL